MMVNMNYSYIYKIVNPLNMEVVYIGKANNIFDRIHCHITDLKSPVGLFIQELLKAGEKPLFVLIEQCHMSEVGVREMYWMYKFKQDGANLLNRRFDKIKELKYDLKIEIDN